nr:DUF1259 domain-containing protein [uncultured Bacillus sp.]
MKQLIMILTVMFLIFNIPSVMHAETGEQCEILGKIFGKEAVETKDKVCAVEILRDDLNLTHMGKKLSPETMEVAFQIAFEEVNGKTAVMGEMALLEDEVNPVIDELRKGKFEISALHNHMIQENPRILYLHFQGIGELKQQAETIKKAIAKTMQ